ncbi:MAG: hypothetical protein ACREDR_16385 [Blastocatellia bacterium]
MAVLDLSTVQFLKFQRADISTVGQLLELELEDFARLKLGEKSIQDVVRKVQALDLLAPLLGLAEAFFETVSGMQDATPNTSESTQRHPSTSSREDTVDPIVLTGHRYGWAVSIDDSAWSKREQWYLDFAPGTFPYAVGTLVEHNAQLYVITCVGTSMLRVATLKEDELEEEEVPVEEPLLETEHSQERLAAKRAPRWCFEVAVSSLPMKYRDRISRRQRTCWIMTPEPSPIRPGYFTTRIGSTPDKVHAKAPIFLTEEEAAVLVPVAQAPSPAIKVAPAFLLPEAVRRAAFPGIAHPSDLWRSPSKQFGTQAAKQVGEPPATGTPVKVPVPEHLSRMPITQLELSPALENRLRLSGITRVGPLLEMAEDSFREISIGEKGMLEIGRRLQAVHALPSEDSHVYYDECYLHITDLSYTDEQQDTWCMAYVSVFPDRLSGWRSGPIYTVWLLQQHVDLAMEWDRGLLSLDTHTLRVLVNEHVLEQGVVAPPLRAPSPKRSDDEQGLSASQNIFIPREATDGLLDDLPPGEEKRRYQERQADQLFGLQQEEWLALGHQAAEREREQLLRAGHRKEAFGLELVAACIEQVEDWYAGIRRKPRILGLCGVFVEDRVPRERTYIIREKGRSARKKTVRWTEPTPRLVGYHLVVGAPPWVTWPEGWMQKSVERQIA